MKLLTTGERPLPEHKDVFASHIDFAIDTRYLYWSIEAAVHVLKHYEFDALAFRGMSGALIAPSVALRLNKSMILVRKENDDSHSGMCAEGDKTARTYIIIDDFQSTGYTAHKTFKGVQTFAPNSVFIGFLPVRRLTHAYSQGQEIPLSLEDIKGKPHIPRPRMIWDSYECKLRLPLETYQEYHHLQNLERLERLEREQEEHRAVKQERMKFDPKIARQTLDRWRINFPEVKFMTGDWVTNVPEPTPEPEEKKDVELQPKVVVRGTRGRVGSSNAMPRGIFGQPDRKEMLRRARNYTVQGV